MEGGRDLGDVGGLVGLLGTEKRRAWAVSAGCVIAAFAVAAGGLSVAGSGSENGPDPTTVSQPADRAERDPLQSAAQLIQDGDLQQASVLLSRARRDMPANALVPYNLGVIASMRGELAQAADLYREAVALDGRYALARFNLAVTEETRGRLAVAASEYQRALAIDPQLTDAAFNLGLLLYRRGNTDSGVALLRGAIEARPGLEERLPPGVDIS